MRNFYTKEIKEVYGLHEAVRICGVSTAGSKIGIQNRNPSRLFGEWEIKLEGDNSPWFYEDRTELAKNGRYHIEVTEEDGTIREFRDTRDFIKFYKLWNLSSTVYTLATILKERRPGIKVRITKKGTERKVWLLDLETGEKKLYDSVRLISRTINLAPCAITNSCLANNNRPVKGKWIFKYQDLDDGNWEPNWSAMPRKISIIATNEKTGEVREIPSLRETSRELGIERQIIKIRLRNGKPYKGWYFRLKED